MVRIHDALDTATLAHGSTSGAAQQDETINQHAFDQQLDEIPPEPNEQTGAGPAHSIASDEVADVVNQQPDLKLVVISNRVAPFDLSNPRPAALPPPSSRSCNGPARCGSAPRKTGATGPCSRSEPDCMNSASTGRPASSFTRRGPSPTWSSACPIIAN